MNEDKICRKCVKKINEDTDRYVHIEDWSKRNIDGDSWWHLECFKKSMNKDLTALEQQAALMLGKARNIYNNLPDEFKQEQYVIQ